MNLQKIFKTGGCFIAAAGFFASAAVLAQSAPASEEPEMVDTTEASTPIENGVTLLSPIKDWSVSAKSDRCVLSRTFGTGEDEILLRMEKGGTDATFNLTLFGDRLAFPMGSIISLQFGPGQDAFGRNYIPAKSSKGRPVIMMYGASFAAALEQEDGGYTAFQPDTESLSQMQYLQVERAGLRPFRLDFEGSLAEVSKSMDACTALLMGKLRVSSTGKSRSATPTGNPGEWVTPRDYPRMMLSYKKEGVVRFRLTVNKVGKPTFCTVDHSSLPQMFDNAVCLALLKKARFEPALDWEGKPAESYWHSAVRFEIK